MSKRPGKSRKNSKRQNDGNRATPNAVQTIPRSVRLIMPDRMITNLKFWKAGIFDLSAQNTSAVRYRPSSAFDIDPLIGSTAMPGFVEFSAFYGSYRVVSSKCVVEGNNPSVTDNVMYSLGAVNVDPGSSPSSAYVIASHLNPYFRAKTAPLNGGPLVRLNHSMSTEKIYGSKSVYFDDNFSSIVTTSPVNNWYWVLTCYSLSLLSNDVQFTIKIEVDVEFFDRSFLFS